MAAAARTVLEAVIECGVPLLPIFDFQSPAERIAEQIFGDSFEVCNEKTNDEIDEDLKCFHDLAANAGRIRLLPGVRRNLKAFVYWVKHAYRTSQDPSTMIFDVALVGDIVKQMKTHEAFIAKSKTIIETAKPVHFTDKQKWEEWFPTFRNFLRSIPGRSGVPLSYVIRDDDLPAAPDPNRDMMEDYVLRAPITGNAFTIDAAEVHLYITKLTSGNTNAEAKLLSLIDDHNGRADVQALKDHYEGIGINSVNLLKADEILAKLFYAGEKKPHMWWDEFERQLTFAFTSYDKKEGYVVHSNEHRLRLLTQKIQADFLQAIKSQISVELAKIPLTMTYETALRAFRNEVNRKFPPEMTSKSNTKRRLQELTGRGTGRGVGRGGRSGRGGRKGGRGGKFNDGGSRSSHPEERYVTGKDGKTIPVHASYAFNRDTWFNLPENERKRISNERQAYNAKKRRVSEANIETPNEVPGSANTPADISVITESAASNSGSMMGGRNAQQRMKSKNVT